MDRTRNDPVNPDVTDAVDRDTESDRSMIELRVAICKYQSKA